MALYTLERSQTVALSLEACWRFFSDPRNLAKLTPASLGFRVESKLPAEIHPGLMIRYTVSPLFRIPSTWVSEITQVQRPNYFVDEQRVGPYRIWHHEHFFRALDATHTEVRDLVTLRAAVRSARRAAQSFPHPAAARKDFRLSPEQ